MAFWSPHVLDFLRATAGSLFNTSDRRQRSACATLRLLQLISRDTAGPLGGEHKEQPAEPAVIFVSALWCFPR